MRVPIDWLGDHVAIPAETTPRQVLDALVRVGLEDEAIHVSGVEGPVVVGEVLSREPEPQSNGKTINWCQVRVAPEGEPAADGGADVRGIVCGAHNFEAGDKVVVTLPGAVLPGDFRIAARKTYGHVSDGMIASERELGLGDDHNGIIVLGRRGLDPEPGTPALPLLGLDAVAVEVNITPDRGYAMSMRGLAREYAHATGAAFHDPALRPELAELLAAGTASDPAGVRVPVTIADQSAVRDQPLASVFVGLVVSGVDGERPTPAWMVQRLRLAGIRPLSLLIDITNYVMIELGQPIHGYDLAALQGGLQVRRATAGETLTTLDGKARTLSEEDILICDDRGPIGLAGVMGGAETELSASTTEVYIEAANFAPISIARTARRHKLPSEASRRFERQVDPAVAGIAAARVAELLIDLAGGRLERAGSVRSEFPAPRAILMPLSAPTSIMGVDYAEREVVGALRAVGCEVWDEANGVLSVVPPTWRPDLTEIVNLVEEVGRLGDFDRIPSVLPHSPAGHGLTSAQIGRRRIADVLAAIGAVEVLSYPFVTEADASEFGRPDAGEQPAMRLANALDEQTGWLRTSTLPGLIGVAHRNVSRGRTDLAVFELGRVFRPVPGVEYGVESVPPVAQRPDDATLAGLEAGLPPQPYWLGALLIGDRTRKQPGTKAVAFGWQDAIEFAHRAADAVRAEIRVEQGTHRAFHPGRCARISVVDAASGEVTPIGWAGELHPHIATERDLPRVVAALELDLDLLLAHASPHVAARAIVGFPAATQDLSLVVPLQAPADEVRRAVIAGAGDLLESIRLVDDYRGSGVDDGEKSLTFALRFRAADRTLTAAEATSAKESGAAVAAERFGATVRV